MRIGVHFQYVWAEHIVRGSRETGQRTGQYLFNLLPDHLSGIVTGTLWDPFHKDLEIEEIHQWIQDHLIFDGHRIIALFNNDEILWEES